MEVCFSFGTPHGPADTITSHMTCHTSKYTSNELQVQEILYSVPKKSYESKNHS